MKTKLKSIFNTDATYLPAITCDDGELRQTSLASLLLSDRWREQVEAVRAESDPEKKADIKRRLPAFMPSGVFNRKSADGLLRHSGYICIDIDGKDNREADNFADLKTIIGVIPSVEYCGVSVGGNGYFCLIPIADPAKHRDYFRAIEHDFKCCGVVVDRKCVNVNRLRFVSYDPEPYVNTGAEVYDYTLPTREHKEAKAFIETTSRADTDTLFDEMVRRIETAHADITGGYGQWFEILCAIASTYGEGGRGSAHAISRQFCGYDANETDRQFTECVRHNGYGYTIGTFFYYAKLYV